MCLCFSDCNVEDLLSPDDPAPDKTFGWEHNEGSAQK
jgi:hypothetical protein